MLPVTVPPRVKAGVVVPQYGVPDEFVRKNEDVEAEERPVPPFPTARMPTRDEVEMLVRPDPLPVNIFEPMLILPKPDPIEPEMRVPTVVRFKRLVMDEVAREEMRPFVAKRRPLSDEANVVVPETFNVPVAVRFVEVALPVIRALPETVRVEPGVVVPMPTLPRKTLFRLDEAAKKFEAAD